MARGCGSSYIALCGVGFCVFVVLWFCFVVFLCGFALLCCVGFNFSKCWLFYYNNAKDLTIDPFCDVVILWESLKKLLYLDCVPI